MAIRTPMRDPPRIIMFLMRTLVWPENSITSFTASCRAITYTVSPSANRSPPRGMIVCPARVMATVR